MLDELEKVTNENRAANFIICNLVGKEDNEHACMEQVTELIKHMKYTGNVEICNAFRLGKSMFMYSSGRRCKENK